MEDSRNESSSSEFSFSIPDIRASELDIRCKIKELKLNINEENINKISNMCNEVSTKILYTEDEDHFTDVQNLSRKIYIASQLSFKINCLHHTLVDHEFARAVRQVLEAEKYEQISRRILKLQSSERREKNFFLEQARKKLKTGEDESQNDQEAVECQPKVGHPRMSNGLLVEETQEAIALGDRSALREAITPEPAPQYLNIPETRENFHDFSSLSDLRAEFLEDRLPLPNNKLLESHRYEVQNQPLLTDTLPNAESHIVSETLIGDHLNDGTIRPVVDNLLVVEETRNETVEIRENQEENADLTEDWSLSCVNLQELPKKKRHRRVLIDRQTVIPNYSERALRLNENIETPNVQVYEGPPSILEAFSVNNLMSTAGFRNNFTRFRRSFVLQELYQRYLRTDRRPAEIREHIEKKVLEEKRPENIQAISSSVTEKIEKERVEAMAVQFTSQKRDMLVELSHIQRQTNLPEVVPRPENINTDLLHTEPVNAVPEDQNNIANTIPAITVQVQPEKHPEKIQHAQSHPPWFLSTKRIPPSEKWREFNFVMNILEKYWALQFIQEGKKCILAWEILKMEKEESVPNYLTLLRILDKLSLKRKVFLKETVEGIMVFPFEVPYVTEKQFCLRNVDPTY